MNHPTPPPQPAPQVPTSEGQWTPSGTSTTGSLLQGLAGNFFGCQD